MTKYPLRCILGFHRWMEYWFCTNNICWEERLCNRCNKHQWKFEGEREWHEN